MLKFVTIKEYFGDSEKRIIPIALNDRGELTLQQDQSCNAVKFPVDIELSQDHQHHEHSADEKCCQKPKKIMRIEDSLYTMEEIKAKFDFDFKEHLKENELIEEKELIVVWDSEQFNLKQVGIQKHVPNTKNYMIFEYRSPNSRRIIRLLQCQHKNCGKVFRKWHNFFDHLRIHTNEKPYQCRHQGCNFSFTQKANLNKHMEIHQGKKRFQCNYCSRGFFTKFNLNVSLLSLYS